MNAFTIWFDQRRRGSRTGLGFGAAIVLGAVAGCDRGDPEPVDPAGEMRPNILLLTLDTTRADVLHTESADPVAPNLDALADQSLRCTLARSPSPLTLPAHSSMFTGLYPFAHGVRDNDAYRLHPDAQTLAHELSGSGYRTSAVLAATVLNSSTGLDRGFDVYDDLRFQRARHAAVEAERRADEVTDRALEHLAKEDPRPWFLWVHYFDPHYPYRPPDLPGSTSGPDAYWAEVRYLDEQIGRLLEAVRGRADFDRTAIAVIADHGEGLRSVQEDSHGFLCEEPTLRIPFFLRTPRAEHRGDLATPTSTVDLFPTLLALAGLDTPYPVHGRNLLECFRTPEEDRERAVYFETYRTLHVMGWSPMQGIATSRWKFVDQSVEELFDLDAEEGERRSVAEEFPEDKSRLARELRELLHADVTRFETTSVSASPAEAARLMQLGYLSRTAKLARDPAEDLPNPRVHYRSFVAYQSALGHAAGGDLRRAIELLDEVVRRYPRNPSFRDRLGEMLARAGRLEDAELHYREAIALKEDLLSAVQGLGQVLERRADPAGAEEQYRRVLELFPDHFSAAEALFRLRRTGGAARDRLEDCLRLIRLCDELEGEAATSVRQEATADLTTQLTAPLDDEAEAWRGDLRARLEELPAATAATLRPLLTER